MGGFFLFIYFIMSIFFGYMFMSEARTVMDMIAGLICFLISSVVLVGAVILSELLKIKQELKNGKIPD